MTMVRALALALLAVLGAILQANGTPIEVVPAAKSSHCANVSDIAACFSQLLTDPGDSLTISQKML